MHIVKGDMVLVISGNDKGKIGKVLRVVKKRRNRWQRNKLIKSYPKERLLVVEHVNFIKRHTRKNASQAMPEGGILEREAPIHISNVMLVCPNCSSPTRVATKQLEGNERIRVCQECGEDIPKPEVE